MWSDDALAAGTISADEARSAAVPAISLVRDLFATPKATDTEIA